MAIVIAPVFADRKGDQRNADRRAVLRDRQRVAAPRIGQALAENPTAHAVRKKDVAPIVVWQAPDHPHIQSWVQHGHDRVACVGSGEELDRCVDVDLLGLGGYRQKQGRCAGERGRFEGTEAVKGWAKGHGVLPVSLVGRPAGGTHRHLRACHPPRLRPSVSAGFQARDDLNASLWPPHEPVKLRVPPPLRGEHP